MEHLRQIVIPPYTSVRFESLEDRVLMATTTPPWGYWPAFLGMDKVVQNYPWLNGGGNNVAVIDKGIDYWHPALGGNEAKGIKSPRVVNVWDYQDNNNNPFPRTSELVDPSSAHATGVAGILAALPYNFNNHHYQGILQNSKLYNIRTNRFNSQQTIKQALDWVLANHTAAHITAINLTDFIGTGAAQPVYASEVQALWNAGVFMSTPVANDWLNPQFPHYPIGYPAKSPYVFGEGGILRNGQMNPKTQRGPGLDILSASEMVSIPYYIPSTDSHIFVEYGTGNSWGNAYVVGTAVLMQQIDPTITPAQIMKIMQDSGVAVVDPDGTGTYKRLDMYNAIKTTYQYRDDVFGKGAGNHTIRTAATLPMRRGRGAVANMKLLVGAPDWYSITISGATTYNVSLSYAVAGQTATGLFYNSRGTMIGSLSRKGLTMAHKPGTYYLQVTRPQSLVGTYSVNVTPVATTRRIRRPVAPAAVPAIAPSQNHEGPHARQSVNAALFG